MCGIAGILNFDGQQVEAGTLKRMTEIIAHRGPDSEGQWIDQNIGLGHRRLSIIDLSSDAAQPMISGDNTAVITFNGEIYNYKELASLLISRGYMLRTHSDTEVILGLYQLYGKRCLDHLRGMFAFAIWDRNRKELFLARDRVGIKPLYYFRSRQRFVFASEIKAVVASGYSSKRINMDALCQYMRLLVVPQPHSIFDDVHKLEPGCSLVIDANGGVTEQVYWSPSELLGSPASHDSEAMVGELDGLLKESVRYHMVADVPVGAFLSGGLDSSAVVSMMRAVAPKQTIATFSTVFPGMPQYDEDKYARIVSDLKRTDHHANVFEETFLQDFHKIAWHLDEPFAVSSAYATYYLAQAASRETKVVLTGDGGDELFAGYEGYKNDNYLGTGYRLQSLLRGFYSLVLAFEKRSHTRHKAVSRLLTGLARRIGSEGLRYSEQVAQSSLHAISLVMRKDRFMGCLSRWDSNLMAHYYESLGSADRLARKLYAEYKTRLVDEMLMKVDRMTMAHSLEARVPLLDHKLVEFAFRLPSDMKLFKGEQGLITKYALKKALEPYLPNEIVYRRKQGFNIPVKDWMQGAFRNQVGHRVLDGYLVRNNVLEKKGVEEVIRLQSDRRHNYQSILMLLLAFEYWIDAYTSKLGGVTIN